MRRGKSQVLFKYLPESVIDYSDTQSIAKISSWDAVKAENLNTARLFSEISRRINRYPLKNGYPEKPRPESFVYLEPRSIDAEIFPLTFICKECGKAYSFNNIESFRNAFGRRAYRCSCGGSLRQMDIIHYHECGKIEGPKVKPCSKHNFEHIILFTGGSSRTTDWSWRCNICGEMTGRVQGWCNECNKPMESAPFRKSQVFYPHSLTLINTIGFQNLKLYDNNDAIKLYLAKYLGLISKADYGEMLSANPEDEKKRKLEKKRQELLAKNYPAELIDEIIGVVDGSDELQNRNRAIQNVDLMLNLSFESLNSLASSVQGFDETINLEGAKSISEVLGISKSRDDSNYSTIKKFPGELNSIGVSNAYVVSDLPLVSAVFGYSRTSIDPQKCTLKAFKQDKRYPGYTPVYVNSIQTEAIVLELDRCKILQWLKLNGIVSNTPDLKNETELKNWFLRNIEVGAIPVYDEIPEGHSTTKYVYSLLHTISHVLARKASGLVGLDKDSLGEIIFPAVPAIAIYTNNVHDFQIGGMHTLFETGIIPWLDMAKDSVASCLYDPVCISSDASCHACLHLSEVSCEHFNRDLGRHYLLGRELDGIKMTGFWEKEFIESLKNDV